MPPLSPKSLELFAKAEQAFDSHNYDYAIMLYRSVLDANPEYHPVRFKLHMASWQARRGRSLSMGDKIKGYMLAAKPFVIGRFKMFKQDWLGAIQAWEECLALAPLCALFHRELAECLERAGWKEAALNAYRVWRNIHPRDPIPLWEMARLHSQDSRWDDARDAYEMLAELHPTDTRVTGELRKIAAIQTIEKGGWSDTLSYRDKIRDERQAKFLEQKDRLVKSSSDIDDMLEVLNAKRQNNTSDLGPLREIAKLHRLKGNLDKAKEVLREALKTAPSDFFLIRELTDIQLEEMDRDIELKRHALLENPDNASVRDALEGLLGKYRSTLLEDKKAQVSQYPTNLLLRFELGELFLAASQVDEAIAELQQAVKNPSKRLESQKFLGQCFHKKHLYDLAIEQLAAASEAVHEMTSFKKDILYELATVYEEMGRDQEAKREYEKIYASDIAFKDVAQKIEKKFRKT